MGCHALFQGIFWTQGLNLCLLHCRRVLYHWAIREANISTSITRKGTAGGLNSSLTLPSLSCKTLDGPHSELQNGDFFFYNKRTLPTSQKCFEDLMSQCKSMSSRMCKAHWNFRDYYLYGVSHLSSSLQSDNSAGEQLCCREGERMVGVGGCER